MPGPVPYEQKRERLLQAAHEAKAAHQREVKKMIMRRHRAKKKAIARAARHAEIVVLETARQARKEEAARVKEAKRLKRLGRDQGLLDGWHAAAPQTPESAKAHRRAYNLAYEESRLEHIRVNALLATAT